MSLEEYREELLKRIRFWNLCLENNVSPEQEGELHAILTVVNAIYHELDDIIVPPKQSEPSTEEMETGIRNAIKQLQKQDDEIIERFHEGWITEKECKCLRNSLPRTKKTPNDDVNSKLWGKKK